MGNGESLEPISAAICFATEVFDGKYRKLDKTPAIFHSLEVAMIAQQVTEERDVVTAAVLHDTVEDAGVSMEEIARRFGPRVAELVASETEDKQRQIPASQTWRTRKETSVTLLRGTTDMGVKALYLADKLSNIRSVYRAKQRMGDGVWQAFNQKDPGEHYWYYQSIADAVPELSHTAAWKEYTELINKIFTEEEI